jgi:hypothetical protein
MKHIRHTSRANAVAPLPTKAALCPTDIAGAFCYAITCEGGMKGILRTGGIAGVHEFTPLFPCLTKDT